MGRKRKTDPMNQVISEAKMPGSPLNMIAAAWRTLLDAEKEETRAKERYRLAVQARKDAAARVRRVALDELTELPLFPREKQQDLLPPPPVAPPPLGPPPEHIITNLGLAPVVRGELLRMGLVSIGDIEDWIKAGNQLRDVSGIGVLGAEEIMAAIARVYAKAREEVERRAEAS